VEKDFDYYAFISYKREDEKWAKWLQNKLENYKLPAVIRKENADLPKEIRPIFRDKTSMEAGIIVDTIQEKLRRSQYLIVICSPKAAQSNWVGSEINAFIEMGRSDRIIPFIVAGVPNSNDSRECFHPHIKEKIPEPLGVNIKEIGKQEAFVKIAAKLLNLRFEALWDRFKIAQRKQRLIAAASCLLFLAGLGWIYNYFYPPKEYYADYVDKKGIPEGIIKLTRAQVKKRNAHYRFEKSKGKLRRVVYANSAGTPVEHGHIEYADRPSIQEFMYDVEGLSKTIIKNVKDELIAKYLWKGINIFEIDDEKDEFSVVSPYNDVFANWTSRAKIKLFELVRNDEGYIIRRDFIRFGDNEVPSNNINTIEGIEYNLGNEQPVYGRPKTIRYLGSGGTNEKYMSDKFGVMGKKYEYDDYGNISKISYFGENDELILNEKLWSIAVYEANPDGNIETEYFLDQYGEHCLYGFEGDYYAKITYEYDKRGYIEKKAYHNIKGKINKIVKYVYNKKGKKEKETYSNADDIKSNYGYAYGYAYAEVTFLYDKSGNITEEAYYNAAGKLINKKTKKYEQ